MMERRPASLMTPRQLDPARVCLSCLVHRESVYSLFTAALTFRCPSSPLLRPLFLPWIGAGVVGGHDRDPSGVGL